MDVLNLIRDKKLTSFQSPRDKPAQVQEFFSHLGGNLSRVGQRLASSEVRHKSTFITDIRFNTVDKNGSAKLGYNDLVNKADVLKPNNLIPSICNTNSTSVL